jgi:hypothetical protein
VTANRSTKGQYLPGGSPGRPKGARNRLAARVAGDQARAGTASSADYVALVKQFAPEAEEREREHIGLAQPREGNLDGEMRDLDERETHRLAGALFGRDHGMPVPAAPAPAEEEKPAQPSYNFRSRRNAASDWSASDMLRYRVQRAAEDAASSAKYEREFMSGDSGEEK